jgi:hypothetical protein
MAGPTFFHIDRQEPLINASHCLLKGLKKVTQSRNNSARKLLGATTI